MLLILKQTAVCSVAHRGTQSGFKKRQVHLNEEKSICSYDRAMTLLTNGHCNLPGGKLLQHG